MSYKDCCDWDKCTLCGECLMKCPVMKMDREEAKAEFSHLLKGEPAPRVFNECTLCFNCNQYCPVEGLRPHELIQQRIIEKRKGRVSALIPYFLNGMPEPTFFPDLYSKLKPKEKEILKRWSKTPPKSKDILFVGCIGRLSCYDIDNSKVLEPLPKFGPPDACCGELHYRLGSWEAYSDRIEKTLNMFSELDIERMVCYCGSCYNFLSNILPNVYGKKLPFKLISLYEWLWERMEKGELEVRKSLNFKAAIHESCYVSELGPEFAETLHKLYKAAGVEIVELEHHGDQNLSCGLASFARDSNILKSLLRTQRAKYKEVKKAGVKDMALNCPGCFLTLAFTNRLFGKKLRYMPDELLSAFGDDVSTPISKRMPLVLRTAAKRFPRRYLTKVDAELPRISH